MNDTKEKSAVRAGTLATEKDMNISSNNIIFGTDEKIKIVLQFPGKIAVATWMTGHMNDVLKGGTTVVTIPENGLKLVMNVHSKSSGKPNLKTLWGKIYGTVLITAMEGKEYVSLTPEQVQSARAWLLKHTYEEELK
jgi:hypothetical protein